MPEWQLPSGSRLARRNSTSTSAAMSTNPATIWPASAFIRLKSVFKTSMASQICSLEMFSGPLSWMTWNTTGMM